MKEFENEKDYQKAVSDHESNVRKAKADLAKAQKQSQSLDVQLKDLQAKRDQTAQAGYDTSELDKQITEVSSKKASVDGEAESASVLMNEPAPKKLIRPKRPATSKGGKNENIGSEDDYQKALRKVQGRWAEVLLFSTSVE